MQKIGFAVSCMVAVLVAVPLVISQIPPTGEYYEPPTGEYYEPPTGEYYEPPTGEYYDVVGTLSFSDGEPLVFDWTFEPNVTYRFEVKGADWNDAGGLTQTLNWTDPPYKHYLHVGGTIYPYDTEGALVENPLSWYWTDAGGITQTLNVRFWHYGVNGEETDQAFTPTVVEVSVPKRD